MKPAPPTPLAKPTNNIYDAKDINGMYRSGALMSSRGRANLWVDYMDNKYNMSTQQYI